MALKQAVIDKAKKEFEQFLDDNKYRKTSERFIVLEELFKLEEHIDVDSFFLIMRNNNHSLSRATIYNTLDLLVEAGLAVKHQFKDKSALYEQAFTYKHHDHLVCNQCHKIKEFSDERIEEIKEFISKKLQSAITSHSLVLYGDCTIPNCESRL